MRYRYSTVDIGGVAYVTEVLMLSEREGPQADNEFARPLVERLLDDNGKLQWALVPNPDYGKEGERPFKVEHRPQMPTPEETVAKERATRKAKLAAALADVLLDILDNEEPIEVLPTRLRVIMGETKGVRCG